MLRRRIVGGAAVAAVIVACTPLVPPHLEYVDHICDTLCHKRGECSPGWDQKTCQTDCRERGNKRRAYWRADYVEAAVSCIANSSCDVVLQKVNAACFRDTKPEPSDIARRACTAAEAKDRECNGAPQNIDECLNKWNWRLYSDPVLEEIIDCEKQHCGGDNRVRCINEAMGGS